MKRCSTSYAIKEMQIKTTRRYHYTPIRPAKIWNTDNTKYWWGCCWQQKLSSIAGGNANDTAALEDSLAVSYKMKHTLSIQSSNHIPLVFNQRSWILMSTQNRHIDIYSCFIHNCQNLEATTMSFSRWKDKLWYIQQWNIISTKKEINNQSMKRHRGTLNAYY